MTRGGSPSISHRSTSSPLLFFFSSFNRPPAICSAKTSCGAKGFHKSINVYHSGKPNTSHCVQLSLLPPTPSDSMDSKNVTGSFALTSPAEVVNSAFFSFFFFIPNTDTVGAFCIGDPSNENKVLPSSHMVATRLYVNCIKKQQQKCN